MSRIYGYSTAMPELRSPGDAVDIEVVTMNASGEEVDFLPVGELLARR